MSIVVRYNKKRISVKRKMSKFAPGTDPDYVNWFNVTQGFGGNERAAFEYGRGNQKSVKQRPKYTEGQTFNSDNAPGAKFNTPKDAPATFSPDTAQATKSKSAPRTTEQELDGIKKGQGTLGNIMSQFFPMEIESDDDGGRALKDGFAVGFLQDYYNRMGSKAMAELDSALGKDNMRFGYYLNAMDKSNDRFENYMYGQQASDRALERQNFFNNQEFGRDIGMLGAVGEQTRANMQEGGKQDRLGYMVQGEETRKGIDFQDRIDARKSDREGRRASTLARSF